MRFFLTQIPRLKKNHIHKNKIRMNIRIIKIPTYKKKFNTPLATHDEISTSIIKKINKIKIKKASSFYSTNIFRNDASISFCIYVTQTEHNTTLKIMKT